MMLHLVVRKDYIFKVQNQNRVHHVIRLHNIKLPGLLYEQILCQNKIQDKNL